MAQTSPDQTLQLNHKTTQNSKNPALLSEGLNTCAKGTATSESGTAWGARCSDVTCWCIFAYFRINYNAFFE